MTQYVYNLFDETLMDTRFKSATDVVNHVVSVASEFDDVDLKDKAWMLKVADKQFKNGRTILLFK